MDLRRHLLLLAILATLRRV